MKFNNDNIVLDSNPLLRNTSSEVNFPITKEQRETVKGLHDYVKYSNQSDKAKKYNLDPAVGIAAPQVGIFERICVVYIEDNEHIIADLAMINPKIIAKSDDLIYLENGEGCLSVKDEYDGYVHRFNEVTVEFKDINNKNHVITADGFVSIAIQHEIDHLNGLLFYDHINKDNPKEVKDNSKPL